MDRHMLRNKSTKLKPTSQMSSSDSLDSENYFAARIAQLQKTIGNAATMNILQGKFNAESSAAKHTMPVAQRKIIKSAPQWVQEQYKSDGSFNVNTSALNTYLNTKDGTISDVGSFNDDYEEVIQRPPSSNMGHKLENVMADVQAKVISAPGSAVNSIKRLGNLINASRERMDDGKTSQSVDYYIHSDAADVEDDPIKQIVFGGSRGRTGYNPNANHLHVGGNAQDNLIFGFKGSVLYILGRVDFHIDGGLNKVRKGQVTTIEGRYTAGDDKFTKKTITK